MTHLRHLDLCVCADLLSPELKRKQTRSLLVRGHNAVTKGPRQGHWVDAVKRRGAMQIQSGLWEDQTCHAMLHYSTPCPQGFTCRKGNFVKPVLLQVERWDFTISQTVDGEMLGVCMCMCVRKTEEKLKKKRGEWASDNPPTGPPKAKCMLKYFWDKSKILWQ